MQVSQDYSCIPSFSTTMMPNLDFIGHLIDRRQDDNNPRTLFDPRHRAYLAEALAEQHRKCMSVVGHTVNSRPGLCHTCRGTFYVEHGTDWQENAIVSREQEQEPTEEQQQ